MRKHLPLAAGALLVALGMSSAQAQNCRIAGTWKSNEQLTLKNMEAARLTDKQRKLLSSNFFDKLVHTYTCKGVTSKHEGTVQTYEFRSMKEWGDTVTIEYYDPDLQRNVKDILTISGNCYSVPLQRLGFEEVFCRVK